MKGLRVRRERPGTPIGNHNLWIAAQAQALDVILVSSNCREFEQVRVRLKDQAS